MKISFASIHDNRHLQSASFEDWSALQLQLNWVEAERIDDQKTNADSAIGGRPEKREPRGLTMPYHMVFTSISISISIFHYDNNYPFHPLGKDFKTAPSSVIPC